MDCALLVICTVSLSVKCYQDTTTLTINDRWQLLFFFSLLIIKLRHLPFFICTPAHAISALIHALLFALPFFPLVICSDHLGGADLKFFMFIAYIYGYQKAQIILFTAAALFIIFHSASKFSCSNESDRMYGTIHPHPFFPYLAAAVTPHLPWHLMFLF